MEQILDLLIQLADGTAKQFGQDCEVVIHDLASETIEHSIVYIVKRACDGQENRRRRLKSRTRNPA